MSLADIEAILDVYELEEIFYQNDLTSADVLLYLVEQRIIVLPEPRPL